MMPLIDLRETRVYQEALEEGRGQGFKQGFQEGFKQGFQEGRGQGFEEIALRLLAKELAPAEVAEITGLPIRRVRALKKSRA